MGCVISHLSAKFAFFPPSPPSFLLLHLLTRSRNKKTESSLLYIYTSSSLPLTSAVGAVDDDGGGGSFDVLSLRTRRGNKIVAFYLKNPYAKLTLLYSHGNATDLGQLFDLFVQLKANLRVNLMGSVESPFLSNIWKMRCSSVGSMRDDERGGGGGSDCDSGVSVFVCCCCLLCIWRR